MFYFYQLKAILNVTDLRFSSNMGTYFCGKGSVKEERKEQKYSGQNQKI